MCRALRTSSSMSMRQHRCGCEWRGRDRPGSRQTILFSFSCPSCFSPRPRLSHSGGPSRDIALPAHDRSPGIGGWRLEAVALKGQILEHWSVLGGAAVIWRSFADVLFRLKFAVLRREDPEPRWLKYISNSSPLPVPCLNLPPPGWRPQPGGEAHDKQRAAGDGVCEAGHQHTSNG